MTVLTAFDPTTATPAGTALTLANSGGTPILSASCTAVSTSTGAVGSSTVAGLFTVNTGSSANAICRCTIASGGLVHAESIYFQVPSLPSTSNKRFATIRNSGGAILTLNISSLGKIIVQDSASVGSAGTTTFSAGAELRAEVLMTVATTTTGSYSVNVYDSSNTLLDSFSSSTANLGTTVVAATDLGVVGNAVNIVWSSIISNVRYEVGRTTEIGPLGGSASVSLTDTGSGDDDLTVAAAVTFDDPAAGTDALTTAAAIPLIDTATGTDTVTIAAGIPLTDTGTGSDAVTITAAVPLTETGTGTDALTTTSAIPLADTGTFTDAISISTGANPNLPDTGTLTDALTVAAAVPLTETAAGTDALAVAATRPLADTATGTDALTLAATRPAADIGAFTDLINTTATLPLVEIGAFTDSLSIDKSQQVPLTDTGQLTDTLKTTAAFGLAELGHFTDGISINKGGSTSRPVTGQQSGHTPAGVTGQTSPARRVTGGSS